MIRKQHEPKLGCQPSCIIGKRPAAVLDLGKVYLQVKSLRHCAFCLAAFVIAGLLLSVTADPAIQKKTYVFICAVGDVMMGTTFPEEKLPPQDGVHLFREVRRSLIGTDIVFGNLEGPLLDGGTTRKCSEKDAPGSCYVFRMPTRYVKRLADAGFNAVSTANNHMLDFGTEGERKTRALLQTALIQPVGGSNIARFYLGGKKVVIAGFTFSRSAVPFPSVTDIPGACRIVRELTLENDIVIVSFHGGPEGTEALHVGEGAEFFGEEFRGETRRFAHAMVDAGADLIIGHGPHVVRGLELYRHRLIAYSLGNFMTYAGINVEGARGVSLVLQVALDVETGRLAWGRVLPVKLRHRGIPYPDAQRTALKMVKQLSTEDFDHNGLFFDESGLFYPSPRRQDTRAYFSPSGY
jgi:hypothetical protein